MSKELRKISCAILLRNVEVGEEVLFEDLDKTKVKLKVVEQEDCDGCYLAVDVLECLVSRLIEILATIL